MTDHFYDRGELIAAMSAPEYAASPRYRAEVQSKLARSMAAGTIPPMGQHISHGEGSSYFTRIATDNREQPESPYGSASPQGADPIWAEAARVRSGVFKDSESIALAMSAPAFDTDPSYRQALKDKIDLSISTGHITPDLRPTAKPSDEV